MGGPELLRTILSIDSTTAKGEDEVARVLEARLGEAGLKTTLLTSPGGRTNLVAHLEGPTDRPALVLLAHSDVVAAEPERWTHDPFGGDEDDGFIWGRGALDMKGVGVMQAEALCSLAGSGTAPERTVIFVSVADEETGGAEGAEWLVSEHAEAVGFGPDRPPPEVLGEGAYGLSGILDVPVMPVVLGEKQALWVSLRAAGDPGHGSLPPARQATLNLARLLGARAGYGPPRVHPVMREQFKALAAATSGGRAAVFRALASPAGDLVARAVAPKLRTAGTIGALLSDTISPTIFNAGYQHNVVPGEAEAAFDCRLLPDTDPEEWLAELAGQGRRLGVEVTARPPQGGPVSEPGPLFDVLSSVSRASVPGCVVVPTLCPGMTDVRFFRAAGAAGYGWVPLVLPPELLATIHGHDERVPVADFERAVEATAEAVRRAATSPPA